MILENQLAIDANTFRKLMAAMEADRNHTQENGGFFHI